MLIVVKNTKTVRDPTICPNVGVRMGKQITKPQKLFENGF